jgi:hypothetical protein
LLFNIASQEPYTINLTGKDREGLEPNKTHLILVYADCANSFGKQSLNATNKNAQALLKADREVGLGVSVKRTSKYALYVHVSKIYI